MHHDIASLTQGVHSLLLPEIGDDKILKERVDGLWQ
jgi:hypothetical protein